MQFIHVVAWLELFVLTMFAILLMAGWLYQKWHPEYPSCDIDPLCHQCFAWAEDGSGWIGNVCVIAGREAYRKSEK